MKQNEVHPHNKINSLSGKEWVKLSRSWQYYDTDSSLIENLLLFFSKDKAVVHVPERFFEKAVSLGRKPVITAQEIDCCISWFSETENPATEFFKLSSRLIFKRYCVAVIEGRESFLRALDIAYRGRETLELCQEIVYVRKTAESPVYCIVFRKNDMRCSENLFVKKGFFGKCVQKNPGTSIILDGRLGQFTRDITMHPASYPPHLVQHFIQKYGKNGPVIDIFAGTGTVFEAAASEGVSAYGIELSAKYAESSVARIDCIRQRCTDVVLQVFCDNAENIHLLGIPECELCVCSPPYWNVLSTSRGNIRSLQKRRGEKGYDTDYSGISGDLVNCESYSGYMKSLTAIIKNSTKIIRKNGHIVVVLQNVRVKGGQFYPLAWDFIAAVSPFLCFIHETVWCQSQKFLGCWAYPHCYVSNVHHHYALVFKKI